MESPHRFFTGERAAQHHFDGHNAVQADLPSPVNHPHPASTDFL
jgi:hypothetical protein